MPQKLNDLRTAARSLLALVPLAVSTTMSQAEGSKGVTPPRPVTHRITGLCCREREGDLREAVGRMPGVALIGIDFERGEAAFTYDPATLFPQAKPAETPAHFQNLLATASGHTFGIKPPSTVPADRLTLVEIPVVGLDCKGCSLGAYEAISRIDGVEYATASFKDGRVTARIDPERTNRPALEAALKVRGVQLKDY